METTSTNGKPAIAREMLDSLSKVIEQLAADVKRQAAEIQKLRVERDEYRKMLVDQVKHLAGKPEDWEGLTEKDFPFTIQDILADIESK